jgi:ELWxxDGT repeat protein
MKIYIAIFLSLIVVTTASGQFSLLKDAYQGNLGSNQHFIRKLKPGTWIASWNSGPGLGQELWRTDGTPTGTSLIKDLYPGSGWGVGYSSDPYGDFMNGHLYFAGTENNIDFGLYKTNGTTGGTTLVKPQIIPYDITNIDNTLYFGGANTQYGIELYKSDGTTAGTVLIKDILPGNGNGLVTPSKGAVFVKANGYIFFRANDGVHGHMNYGAQMVPRPEHKW